MPSSDLPEQLPCGVQLDDLVEQVDQGRGEQLTEHEQHCTHCRAAIAEISRLWGSVTALAAEQVEPPADLVDKVMGLVRELALEIWHVVLPGERGSTRIAARVLATVARRAARRVPGVRVVLGAQVNITLGDVASPQGQAG